MENAAFLDKGTALQELRILHTFSIGSPNLPSDVVMILLVTERIGFESSHNQVDQSGVQTLSHSVPRPGNNQVGLCFRFL